LNLVKYYFNVLGKTIFIEKDLMDTALVIGASVSVFALRFIRGMIQRGTEIGFNPKTANSIVPKKAKEAAGLLIKRKEHPEFEIDKAITPKGCTFAGLNEMEHNGFSAALIKGIVTSYDKIEKKPNFN
jgi:pyrroline-5-carboxylate reductase